MKLSWLIGLWIALLSFAFAQTPTTYRLQPEDILRIQVYDEQQIIAVVPIGQDGNITAPFVGVMRAEGLTTTELEAALVKEYERKIRIRNPKVSVTIEKYRPVRASVVGMVNRPGVYEIRPSDTILDLIGYGGGAIFGGEKIGDLRRATLRRKNSGEAIPIDLYAMLRFSDLSQNYNVEDGDVLTVPEDESRRITVFGQVNRLGAFPFSDGMTIADAVALAAGEVQYRGNLAKIVISRKNAARPGEYTRIVVDFNRYLKKGDSTQNPLLQPGDIIYVPESGAPDLNRLNQIINSVANGLFILDRFGLGVLPRR